MDFLHHTLRLAAGETVEVLLDNPANVQLLDPINYELYKARKPYRYGAGGHYSASPAQLTAPAAGEWHVVVDLGGGAGRVRASVRIPSIATAV